MNGQKGKPRTALGKPSGALNAPIAAFAMAIVLCSYCISSIRTARREAASSPSIASTAPKRAETQHTSWVQQALEEQHKEERKKRN